MPLELDSHSDPDNPVITSPRKPMRFTYASGARPLDGYTIKRGVGMGGFGEVYFATSDAGKEVALKRIQRNLDIELRGVRQCLNLKHPNLLALFDIRTDDQGEAWVVMEYIAGRSLADVLDAHPEGLPREEVQRWLSGIAAGVGYLHQHGIVHRDLKPANIFLDDDVVKIGDYGLSKFISCSRRSGQTESVGTFHYMAPEIGQGRYGKEIDVYALGIILHEMLTGTVPFDGESSQEILMKHLTAEPEVSGLPEPYRAVVARALAKDPAARFADAQELYAAAQGASLFAGIAAESASPLPPRDPEPAPGEKAETSLTEEPPLPEPGEQPLYIGDEEEVEGGTICFLTAVTEAQPPVTQPPVAQPLAGPPNGGEKRAARPAPSDHPEPIAAAVGDAWRNTVEWWHHANLSTVSKVALLVGAVVLLIAFSGSLFPVLLPVGVVLGGIYLVYFGTRAVLLASSGGEPAGSREAAGPPRVGGRRWRAEARRLLSRKPAHERTTELVGSLLVSAVVAGVLSLVMLIFAQPDFAAIEAWSFYGWLTATTIAGAWMVLIPAKLWEAGEGDEVWRRFVMLVLGLALGGAAYGLAALLLVELGGAGPAVTVFPPSMFTESHAPQLPAVMAFFAGLFVLPRWWRQADPLRRSRLSIWPVGVALLCALLLNVFPAAWGVMLAIGISVAVQLSADWMSPRERTRLRGGSQEVRG